jgi:hypothetical protein
VSTVAGTGKQGFKDGPLKSAQFNQPQGIYLMKLNNLCLFVIMAITDCREFLFFKVNGSSLLSYSPFTPLFLSSSPSALSSSPYPLFKKLKLPPFVILTLHALL